MAREFSVTFDLSPLAELGPLVGAGIFSNLARAVETTARVGVERWQTAALKAPLWEGERRAYAAAISYRITGPYAAEIVNDYKYVEDIESGRPPYDMKRMLDTSLKVRVSAKGKRYLIIPMRHNSPGNSAHAAPMPKAVYEEARRLQPSKITGGGMRMSGTGAWDMKTRVPLMVARRKYAWGGRLPPGLTPKLRSAHKADPHAGMVRFEAKGSSSYLTFRVMAEGSSGWIRAAQPGLWIGKAVADSLQRTADIDFAAAIQRDLAGA